MAEVLKTESRVLLDDQTADRTKIPTPSLNQLDPAYVVEVFIVDYVMYRLSCVGYGNLDLFPRQAGRSKSHPDLEQAQRRLIEKAREFEVQYKARFDNRKGLLAIIPEGAFMDYIQTIHGIFADDEINWGRIVGYFSFCGSYCEACVLQGMVRIIRDIVQYSVKYFVQNIIPWILHHGGWDVFLNRMDEEHFQLRL